MSFKSDITNVHRALIQIPGIRTLERLQFTPVIGGKRSAYFSIAVETKEFLWDGVTGNMGGVIDDNLIRQRWKQYQMLVDKRARDVREVLGVSNEYKFRNLSAKLTQIQKTMLHPGLYNRLDNVVWPHFMSYELDRTSSGSFLKKNLLYGMQDVPILGMSMNWYIMPIWDFANRCAEFYFEFSMQAKMRTRPVTFKTFPEVQVGSIFEASFGYDATLWNFYEVVERQSESYIVVRTIQKETRDTSVPSANNVRPIPGKYSNNKLYRVKLSDRTGSPCFKAPDLHAGYAELYTGGWRDETDIRFI